MEVIFGKCGSGKTNFYKQNHKEFEERTIEEKEELPSILSYSNSDFREKKIDLLVNVWFDFDQREWKGKINFDNYPLVTLECHKKCIAMLPVKLHRIGGNNKLIEQPKNITLFPLMGYKTTYWNNEDNFYSEDGLLQYLL